MPHGRNSGALRAKITDRLSLDTFEGSWIIAKGFALLIVGWVRLSGQFLGEMRRLLERWANSGLP